MYLRFVPALMTEGMSLGALVDSPARQRGEADGTVRAGGQGGGGGGGGGGGEGEGGLLVVGLGRGGAVRGQGEHLANGKRLANQLHRKLSGLGSARK